MTEPTLFAISDLHVGHRENRAVVSALRPRGDDDWLIVAGDVGEVFADVAWALGLLASRFAKVVWSPGNHELWTPPADPEQSRGEARYARLVEMCRNLGVSTPEDEYPVWDGPGGPAIIAPLFTLYDYTWRPPGTRDKASALRYAYGTGVVCTDEALLHPAPHPTIDAWCDARIAYTESRLKALPADVPTVLANHYPLVRDPTRILRYPEFALWCGTDRTAGWHTVHNAAAMVYGHLHIPRTTVHDGVPFHEVSLGYPREWQPRGGPTPLREVFPGVQGVGRDSAR
ncbi:metallophosphoesterase family protein [Actinomadura flavalba]|uniref:metallophosphoesterase family protein n=1 Tax=Actinomadura flavalba TaxID=1120938 RepID=UPI0003686D57|nr:metallophosphoesterase [Actinomadura flavalba]